MNTLLFNLFCLFMLTGCTYSITMVHTEGVASDVVDETDNISPSTNIKIPVKPLSLKLNKNKYNHS